MPWASGTKSLGKSRLNYKIDDCVALSIQSIPSEFKSIKLYPKWKAPFYIHKISEDGKAIYVKDGFGKIKNRPISILRIKPWHERNKLLDLFGNPVEMEVENETSDSDSDLDDMDEEPDIDSRPTIEMNDASDPSDWNEGLFTITARTVRNSVDKSSSEHILVNWMVD